MIKKWCRTIHESGEGLNLVGMVFLSAILAAQIWFDYQRPEALNGSDEARRSGHSVFPGRQHQGEAPEEPSDAPWTAYIHRVDEALAQKNVSAAEQAWHGAYRAALGSRRWQGFIAVGDASLRIGEVVGARQAPETKARRLYLSALFRARNQGSIDGVLRSAEAFAALGDREMAGQGLRIAEDLAAMGANAQAHLRVRAFADRMAAGALEAKSPASEPF